jgi:phage recombination protein Bet
MTEVQKVLALEPAAADLLDKLVVVRDTLAPDLSLQELQLFALVAHRSGLDPFARQIYAMRRQGRMVIMTGIDGYRSIAARTGEYDGQDEPIFGPACSCGDEPRGHPEFATVRVYRKGMTRPVGATAYWHEYKPDPGRTGEADRMWRRMPHVMLAKVAEALALRKAFPWDPNRGVGIGSDIYTAEEMAQAAPEARPPLVARLAARAASLAGGDGGPEMTEESGMSVDEFVAAVSELDPRSVAAVRDAMFPGAGSVRKLSPDQRAALARELLGAGEEPRQDEAEPDQAVLAGTLRDEASGD